MKIFEQYFGSGTEPIRVFFAPGRVNLIGEHTDYTGGYVFPAALTVGTWATVRARKDRTFRFASTSFRKQIECHADHLAYRTEDEWANYPKGIIQKLSSIGAELPGCDILFHGNIPNGAGLSSSASIELVTAMALCSLANYELSPLEMAILSKQIENQYIGVNCGIMDQFAVGMGKADHAILLRCNTLEHRYVPLALGKYQLVIINSNKRRELADSKYNERRQECEEGFKIIKQYLPHAADLGSIGLDEWKNVRHHITSVTIRNRVEHVVTENDRVQKSTQALENGDLVAFGQYMRMSHESLRDLYEVTGHELDTLVFEASQIEGCIGARMTGAGFGGCTVNIVHQDHVELFLQRVAESYTQKTGFIPDFYVCSIGDGVREMNRGE